MSLDMLGIGNIISGVDKVADDLFTSDEERLKIALQEKSIETDLVKGQMETDKAEAQHTSIFVYSLPRRERAGVGETGNASMPVNFKSHNDSFAISPQNPRVPFTFALFPP